MSRRATCALLASAVIALGALAQKPAAPQEQQKPAERASSADVEARLTRWMESLDLDLPAEVLSEARALVAPDGALANDARALALVARALSASGLAKEAHALLDASAKALPIEWINVARARLALDEDDLDGVLALLWDSSAKTLRTPAVNEAWLLAAKARVRRGEWDQAPALLQRYLELEPRSSQAAGAWHLLAVEASRRQDGARARECAQREDSLGRWHAYYRARILQVREHPREPLPRLGLAQLWLEADDPARARVVLDELLAIAPEFARGWLALGEAQRKQNDLAGARKSYDAALGFDPSLDIARYNRAVIARIEARDEAARADFEVLLSGAAGRDPHFASAHLELARLYAKLKDTARATAAYARYQALGGKEKL